MAKTVKEKTVIPEQKEIVGISYSEAMGITVEPTLKQKIAYVKKLRGL